MWKTILAVALALSLILVAVILYVKSYYIWSPIVVYNPLDKGWIEPVRSFKLRVPKGCDKGFGAADPFFTHGCVFAEVTKKGKGIIAVADSREGGLNFVPVLEEKFHLSYPHVFNHSGRWYMIPEASQSGSILLYRAKKFPYEWEKVGIISDIDGLDSTTFNMEGRWYMFTTSGRTKENMIMTTDNFPLGPWRITRFNPLPKGYRGGGQSLYHDGEILLPLQPPTTILNGYGWKLELHKVNSDLSMERVTTFYPPKGAGGVHHLSCDPTTKQCMVDLRRYLKR